VDFVGVPVLTEKEAKPSEIAGAKDIEIQAPAAANAVNAGFAVSASRRDDKVVGPQLISRLSARAWRLRRRRLQVVARVVCFRRRR
jgi:hypothetical protein